MQIRNSENKDEAKRKRKTKGEVKNKLIRSLQECEVVENKELNERTQSVTNHEQVNLTIQNYQLVFRSKKKGILNVALNLCFRHLRVLTSLSKCFKRLN